VLYILLHTFLFHSFLAATPENRNGCCIYLHETTIMVVWYSYL